MVNVVDVDRFIMVQIKPQIVGAHSHILSQNIQIVQIELVVIAQIPEQIGRFTDDKKRTHDIPSVVLIVAHFSR